MFILLLCLHMEIAANFQPKTLKEAIQENALLKKIIKDQQEKIEVIQQQYENLEPQVKNLLHGKFGKKSEALNPLQYSLFGEEKPKTKIEEPLATVTYTRKKRNGHHNIPDDLPRERFEYEMKSRRVACGFI